MILYYIDRVIYMVCNIVICKTYSDLVSFSLRARRAESSLVAVRAGILAKETQLDIQTAPHFPAWLTKEPKGPH